MKIIENKYKDTTHIKPFEVTCKKCESVILIEHLDDLRQSNTREDYGAYYFYCPISGCAKFNYLSNSNLIRCSEEELKLYNTTKTGD